jgi:hypothetical protein
VEHRIHFTRREQHNTLQSHLLVPVSLNGRSGFLFSVEPSRSRTLVSARTIETLGVSVVDPPSTVTISEKLVYPLVQLESIGVSTAELNSFEVVVWGRPVIPPEILANQQEDRLYHLGYNPQSAIDSVIECRGVLGADFLRNFTLTLDLRTDTLVLER